MKAKSKNNTLQYKSQEELFELFKEEKNSNLFGSLMALALLSSLFIVVTLFIF